MGMAIPSSTIYRLYLARERLRDGITEQSGPSPLGRMRGILALDDAVELVVVTLLPVLGIRPQRDASLANLLGALVNARPALSSHSGPVERLRRLRDRVKHDGIVPSGEDLRLNAVEAESFVRAAVSAVTDLTLEQTSPLEAIQGEDIKAHLITATAKLDEGDYVEVCIAASQAFALGRRRFEFKTEGLGGRDVMDRSLDDLVNWLSRAAQKAAASARDAEIRHFAQKLGSALREERSSARDLFDGLALPIKLARLGIDLTEFERFERLTPHINVQSRGDWCEVVMTRTLTPNRQDAFFVLDFVIRSLLGLQDRLARRSSEVLP